MSLRIVFRPITEWPGKLRTPSEQRGAQFSAHYEQTLKLLRAELEHLDVDEAVIQLALDERDIRNDGWPRANAKPRHDGVILSFDLPGVGPMRYATDVFSGSYSYRGVSARSIPGWQNNLRAIALGLEALRKVDRYGIAGDRQQYTGWKALGAGIPMGPGDAHGPFTVERAAEFIADNAIGMFDDGPMRPWGADGKGYHVLIEDERERIKAYRIAALALHPDKGGDQTAFQRLQEAKRVLDEHA